MQIRMNIEGVEAQYPADTAPARLERSSVRTWLMTAAALILTVGIGTVGLMLGLTIMLIMLGLTPIAIVWFWYVTRDSSQKNDSFVSKASVVTRNQTSAHVTSEVADCDQPMTPDASGTTDGKRTHD